MKMIFHFHANKAHFHKKGCVLGLILKVRAFETRKWSITIQESGEIHLIVPYIEHPYVTNLLIWPPDIMVLLNTY